MTGAVERWEAIEALVGRLDPALSDQLMGDIDHLVEVSRVGICSTRTGS